MILFKTGKIAEVKGDFTQGLDLMQQEFKAELKEA
jgi:hypothetical protein